MCIRDRSWTADSKFTELYINGAYIGSYQLTQSIKIDAKRMSLNKAFGQIVENDPHYASDGVPGFKGLSGMPFSFKEDVYKREPTRWRWWSATVRLCGCGPVSYTHLDVYKRQMSC